MDSIENYISNIEKRYKSGISGEHAYRPGLQNLLEILAPDVLAINDPNRVACGAPDFILTKRNIPIGYIEAKDIGEPLDGKRHKEQFDRYRNSLNNLIITDYLKFLLYRDGSRVATIELAEISNGKILVKPENFEAFTDLIKEFSTHVGQTIQSAPRLSKMMAGKARLLAKIIENALVSDEENAADSTLKDQMKAFKEILIHDIKPKDFADIYAQTIAYGMFAARLHDPTLDDFSRQEAAELIPKSNPFLRNLFQYIAGYDLDDRIRWIVDALADIFRATNVAALMKNFVGSATQQNDPVIHFYETFLAEYDPKLRRSRGVWYTPEPVVNFIVRAVDDILKNEFDLLQGLADTTKTHIKIDSQTTDKRTKSGYVQIKKEVHKVQILDPAAGTGTFLTEVVKHIYQKFIGQQGIWNSYVEDHLIPRLNGFEILMASYAMAHLKLDLLLSETGYKPKTVQRLSVFLTNSLEEHHPDTGTLFSSWLSREASKANYIKRDTPVMVVLGNPPYSTSSTNKGEWIQNLLGTYKKGLNERNINSLSDDYVKFIRYGEHLINKNGEGILAYISNNSFIDGVTHRKMREHLVKTFDNIYILNLHGDSNKRESCPDGSPDKNVFDIKQGVSINLFVKSEKEKRKRHGKVFYYDLYGTREFKYKFLWEESLEQIPFSELQITRPYFFFIPKRFEKESKYQEGFVINELFIESGTGIKFRKDNLLVRPHNTRESVENMLEDITLLDKYELLKKYSFKETKDWKLEEQRKNFLNFTAEEIIRVQYRPFDTKYTYYPLNKISKIIPRGDSRKSLMRNMLLGKNYALLTGRQNKSGAIDSFFITNLISEMKCAERTIQSYHFPLYIYHETTSQQSIVCAQERMPNLSRSVVNAIAEKLNLKFTVEKEQNENSFSPIDILDYIYAYLYSSTYRETYKDFLKVDFPRIPYPKDKTIFWQLAKLGSELRKIHLLENTKIERFITTYPKDGDNSVTRKINIKDFEITDFENDLGRVWINDDQYFGKIPTTAWEFYIGGYQPAQKWLKDRHGRILSFEDIQHYQKIIVALAETYRIMKEIDKVIDV